MKNSPLLSVVIATRNRIPYAISAIKSILEIPDQRLELVVQDNSDSRELESYVTDNVNDSRLCYRYTPPPFSMIDNFNAAIELATGEYLCLIGDDDGVNPEIMEAADWAKSNDLDAITSKIIVNYLWKGTGITSTFFSKVTPETISIVEFSGKSSAVDVRREVMKLLRNGGVYYLDFHLPKLYHGLIHRRCLEDIHEKIGCYFQGLSPDIFAVMSISQVAERVAYVDYPLTIPGACPGSGSMYSDTKRFGGGLEDTVFWRERDDYNWCELVPRVFTGETLWVDSSVAALRAMGRDDLVRELNLPKLAAYCIGRYPGLAGLVLRDMFAGLRRQGKNPVRGAMRFVWSLATGPGVRFAKRAWNRFLLIMGVRVLYEINGLKNMVEASHALTRYLQEGDHSFSKCVRRRT